jgi:hypothetical protein
MSQNPYQSPNTHSFWHTRRRFLSGSFFFAVVGSLVLLLLGLAIAVLGTLPSDASGFFLLSGLHLASCGLLGVICAWIKPRGPIRHSFCWMSIILNAALVVRIAMLIVDGTVRGDLIVAAPLLLGIPAALNVVEAALDLYRGGRTAPQSK